MTWSQRGLRWAVLPLLAALSGAPAYARVRHSDAWARDHFAAAERMREALNGRPQTDRTRRDYQRVINAYRYVYFGAPTSSKADPSVVAVAETLVEMGRRFNDDKILNEAIAQYKFLRKEYPGSKYRCDALFTIGEIYKDDLNDPEQARTVFQEFVHRYPHNRLVEDAQQAVIEIDREASASKKAQKNAAKETADKGKNAKDSTAKSATNKADATKDVGTKAVAARDKDYGAQADDAQADAGTGDSADADDSAHKSGRLPRVTGIRHWSTPDYTRVAIDLEGDVKYGSQRIANPDRIFFDLRDTKLSSTLVGKSFDVDDGFLKKIRVAQFAPGRTRVVLEVDSLSDYEAFLLPNPYRLIIDIHGKGDKAAHAKPTKEQEAALADAEAPPKTGSKPEVPKSVLKADVKALSGKPVSKKEAIHDQPNTDDDRVADRGNSANAKNGDAPEKSKTTEVDVKTPTGTIKKVIVPPDDDDDTTPVEAANLDVPKADSPKADLPKGRVPKRSRLKAADAVTTVASTKDDHGKDDDSTTGDDTATVNPPVASHVRGKSLTGKASSRLASNRAADLDVREAKPTASGDRSLIRALGLKIGKIVIDPGHGGHDTGTIGPNGLEEKDLVLEVGRRLGKLLETRLGAEVVYTRKDDTFIPLETRTAIANQQRADLFISIHANSSHDPAARGVETYYLNFTSSPEALEVAARENAVSEKSIYELQDLVKKIALKEKIEESREFAGDVQESLHSGLASKSPGIRDRGVKKAPFIVLIGANMPSILAEISFVSNPGDEHRLETSDYRQRIAESLYRGISKYVNGLSGVKVASKIDRDAGQ
jgi:N-acetylmuramoyl-L-alanine amidase